MSIIKVKREISEDDFITLWNHVVNGEWSEVIPDFEDVVRKQWKKRVKGMFKVLKSSKSYGIIGDTILASLSNNMTSTSNLISRKVPYALSTLKRTHSPFTYRNYGDLEKIMSMDSSYVVKERQDSLSFKVNIPMKTRYAKSTKSQYGYLELENQRSYIKSALILAWPKLMRGVLENIGDYE